MEQSILSKEYHISISTAAPQLTEADILGGELQHEA